MGSVVSSRVSDGVARAVCAGVYAWSLSVRRAALLATGNGLCLRDAEYDDSARHVSCA
ncbi:hypothetical protein XMIN_392 [Xanthomonas citri pv. mangiferaeindicae LMG 941]|nr:hypothetical protein XMIN_392 [Xanthomonas citri pv. mangiferaeindicae LMG 941]